MERIKAALEKARAEKAQKAKQAQPVESVAVQTESVENERAEERTLQKQEKTLENLEYQQTRVTRLNYDHLEQRRIISFNKHNLLSNSFDLLRTQVLQKMEQNGWKTLAITSPTPEAGKTVIAINLAMSIAHQTDKTAMLVDFDLRKPKVGQYLGLDLDKSLNDYLDPKASVNLEDIIINPQLPRFVVLPTAKKTENSSEVLSSSKVTNLISELKSRYDDRYVIFDLPPLLNTDDAIAVLPQIDCVLMVVANGGSTKQEIEESLRHLPDTNLLGVVLNKAEEVTRSYY